MKSTSAFVGASVVILLALGCSSEPTAPLGTISSEQAQQLVLERDAARDAAAARERALQAQIDGLAAEVADLRGQLGMAQETAEQAADRAARYEAGLGRAVEKLNEVSQAAATPTYAAAPTRTYPAARAPQADVSYFSSPRLSIVDRSVVATGRLFNSGDVEGVGRLVVDLVRDGQVVSTKEQNFRINQRSWGSWQEEFSITPNNQAQWSVLVRFESD